MLKHRLISAAVLLTLVGLVCFWQSPYAGAVLTVAAAVLVGLCFREFFRLTRAMGYPGYPVLVTVAGVLLIVAVGAFGVAAVNPDVPWGEWCSRGRLPAVEALLLVLVLVGGIGLTLRATDLRVGILNLLVSLGGYLYLAWAGSCLLRIYFVMPANPTLSKVLDAVTLGTGSDHGRLGPTLFLFVILVTKCGDIGGYVVGSLTARRAGGNHQLIPKISPKKSWEGLGGGLALSVIAAVAIMLILGHDLTIRGPTGVTRTLLSVPLAIIFGVVLMLVGLAGDLVESVLKRAAEAKDAGAVVPGMGGVFDVLDSLLPVAPLFYVYLSLISS